VVERKPEPGSGLKEESMGDFSFCSHEKASMKKKDRESQRTKSIVNGAVDWEKSGFGLRGGGWQWAGAVK